jgi:hypothetical protein
MLRAAPSRSLVPRTSTAAAARTVSRLQARRPALRPDEWKRPRSGGHRPGARPPAAGLPAAGGRAREWVPPHWPDPAYPQQLHLDIRVSDADQAEQELILLGATRVPGERPNRGTRLHCKAQSPGPSLTTCPVSERRIRPARRGGAGGFPARSRALRWSRLSCSS